MKVNLSRVIEEADVTTHSIGHAMAHADCGEQAEFLLMLALEVDHMNWAQQSNSIAIYLKENYSFDGCQQKVIYMLDTLLEHLKERP